MNFEVRQGAFTRNKSLKFIKDLSSSRHEINLGCQEPDRAIKANIRRLALSNKREGKNVLGGGTVN